MQGRGEAECPFISARSSAVRGFPSDPSPILISPVPSAHRAERDPCTTVSAVLPAPHDRPLEEPLREQLFPADGVTWVVSLPTALAGDTIWPGMEWIEALAPASGETEARDDAPVETPEEVCAP